MIGVTVGVGEPYASLSRLAAACFTEATGLSARILGEEDYAESGLPHPAALRLRLFELVESDHIVYFDADWFCLEDWRPPVPLGPNIYACQDFVYFGDWPLQINSKAASGDDSDHVVGDENVDARTPYLSSPACELRQDYVTELRSFCGLRRPPKEWVNTGLLILSRFHHTRWLSTGLELYRGRVGHHPRYYEQPSLLKAMEVLGLWASHLPRQLNVLASYPGKWQSSVRGLHIKPQRHPDFVAAVASRRIRHAEDVRRYFRARAA